MCIGKIHLLILPTATSVENGSLSFLHFFQDVFYAKIDVRRSFDFSKQKKHNGSKESKWIGRSKKESISFLELIIMIKDQGCWGNMMASCMTHSYWLLKPFQQITSPGLTVWDYSVDMRMLHSHNFKSKAAPWAPFITMTPSSTDSISPTP